MRKFLPVLLLLTSACASMSESECRSADWYALGERDGILGLQARIDTYAFQCQRYGVPAASDRYLDGYWIGNATYRDRTAHDGGM
jgi:hypothetical protein